MLLPFKDQTVRNHRLIIRCYVSIAISLAVLGSFAAAQNASQHHKGVGLPHPHASNAQLASPSIERRVEDLLKRMTLEEKLGQLVQYDAAGSIDVAPTAVDANTPGVANNPIAHSPANAMELASTGRLGSMVSTVGAARTNAFQHAAMEKSRLHIPLIFSDNVTHGFRTIFPLPLGLAATFDPELVRSLARMSTEEATTAGLRWYYAPMVDISRDARWGRTAEGAGEDAYLGSAMAAAFVRGFQGKDLSKPDSAVACVKHFAGYGAVEAGRDYNSTDISEVRLRQVYLPPYKAAVDAGAATVMSAFTSLNGVPPTANSFLLQKVLRNEWGFNGVVVSDWMAIEELQNHGVALDAATATRKAIVAGVDVDMMSHYYDTELPALIRNGQVPMSVVDEAVRRMLRVKFALGLFEHPYATGKEVTEAMPEHRPMARQGAEESFVLLQNNPVNQGSPLLPLSRNEPHKIALIGPLADDAQDMLFDTMEEGVARASGVITLKAGLEARAKARSGVVTYVKGTEIAGTSEDGFLEALRVAEQADVVVLALGESELMSGEAGSRANLDLPGNQEKLLEAVAATGRPVVLLVFSGRPLILTWAAQHIPAIMEVWLPGTEAGPAIADVLYGDVSPSGKLPMSFPRAVGQEPLYYNQVPTGRPALGADLSQPPGPNSPRFVSRYIDVPNDALFPFGYGLTYAKFSYAGVAVSRSTVPIAEAERTVGNKLITATATVKNEGDRPATEVVQCYVRNVGASLEQPVRSLKGFTRITLAPGESKTLNFDLGFEELSFYNSDGKAIVEPTNYTIWIGGSSLASEHADFRIMP